VAPREQQARQAPLPGRPPARQLCACSPAGRAAAGSVAAVLPAAAWRARHTGRLLGRAGGDLLGRARERAERRQFSGATHTRPLSLRHLSLLLAGDSRLPSSPEAPLPTTGRTHLRALRRQVLVCARRSGHSLAARSPLCGLGSAGARQPAGRPARAPRRSPRGARRTKESCRQMVVIAGAHY